MIVKRASYYELDIICFGVPEEHDSETVKKLRDMVAACNKADSR